LEEITVQARNKKMVGISKKVTIISFGKMKGQVLTKAVQDTRSNALHGARWGNTISRATVSIDERQCWHDLSTLPSHGIAIFSAKQIVNKFVFRLDIGNCVNNTVDENKLRAGGMIRKGIIYKTQKIGGLDK
jgi:hypothetical protein